MRTFHKLQKISITHKMIFFIIFGYKVLQWTNYHELSMINISPIVIYMNDTPTTCKVLIVISPKAVINHKIIVEIYVK